MAEKERKLIGLMFFVPETLNLVGWVGGWGRLGFSVSGFQSSVARGDGFGV